HGEAGEAKWPINLAIVTLLVVTVLVALVSEIFVESVQHAAAALGMSVAFVGFMIVALVGAAAEMAVAFSAARKNRLDMSVSIALGSASQIALVGAPRSVLLRYVRGHTEAQGRGTAIRAIGLVVSLDGSRAERVEADGATADPDSIGVRLAE